MSHLLLSPIVVENLILSGMSLLHKSEEDRQPKTLNSAKRRWRKKERIQNKAKGQEKGHEKQKTGRQGIEREIGEKVQQAMLSPVY